MAKETPGSAHTQFKKGPEIKKNPFHQLNLTIQGIAVRNLGYLKSIWLWAISRSSGASLRDAMSSASEFAMVTTIPGFHRLSP